MFSSFNNVRICSIILLLITCFFSIELGIRPFSNPDESRYVEMSREMAETNDYVTPRLNGLKYFEKPPLLMWAEAAVIKAFGIDTTSMRILPLVLAAFGCLVIMFAAYHAYGLSTAMLSSSVLASMTLYYVHSRFINLDIPLTIFMTTALWCYFLTFARPCSINRKVLMLGFYIFSALAVLSKGLIGVILPGLVIAIWLIFNGDPWGKKWEIICKSLYVPGILLFFIVAAPWHIMCSLKNDDFAYFYFIHEHFIRYTTNEHCRYQPVWFFIPITIAALLPWTGVSLVSIKNAFKEKSSDSIFLLSWIFSILCFFSFSHSKLIPYILPILPPIAMLTGRLLNQYVASDKKESYLSAKKNDINIGYYISMFLILIAISVGVWNRDLISDVLEDDCIVLLYALFGVLLALAFLWEIAMYYVAKKGAGKEVPIILFIVLTANALILMNRIMVYYQDYKKPSSYHIAKSIKYNLRPDVEVFVYRDYFQDLPIFLNRTIGVVDHVGELEFGTNAENHSNRMMKSDAFLKKFASAKNRIFVCMKREDYNKFFDYFKCSYRILDVSKDFVLVINK